MNKQYGPYECLKSFRGMGGVLYEKGDKPIYLSRLVAQAKLQTGHVIEVGEAPKGVSFSPGKPGVLHTLERPENPYVTQRETKVVHPGEALEADDGSGEEGDAESDSEDEMDVEVFAENDAVIQTAKEALEADDWNLLREAAKAIGVSAGGNKVAVAERIKKRLAALTSED